MKASLRRFWQDESGQALAEYGLVLALVAVGVVAVVATFRDQIVTLFTNMTSSLSTLP